MESQEELIAQLNQMNSEKNEALVRKETAAGQDATAKVISLEN